MRKSYKYLVFGVLGLVYHSAVSQNAYTEVIEEQFISTGSCGTDAIHKSMMVTDAKYRQAVEQMQSRALSSKNASQKASATEGIFQIPVVVHVMHLGEPVGEGINISDSKISGAIERLNAAWRTLEGSIGDGEGVDMHIEFALAIQDEDGNCTNGIERVDLSGIPDYVSDGVQRGGADAPGFPSYLSDNAINSLKELSIWNPQDYYNIWIVNNIGTTNIAGFAFLAGAHGRPFDGTVITARSFTSRLSTTLAHELGHAFNLLHTFQGDDSDGDGIPDQCSDDGVDDTPMHFRRAISFRDCDNTDENTCDPNFDAVINPETGFRRNTGTHQDHLFNYMNSNSGCRSEFTGGQRTVASNALDIQRQSFLNSAGLIPVEQANVNYIQSLKVACVGTNISFTDTSSCTPNTFTESGYEGISFLWTFDNGEDAPLTSTAQNPSIAFTSEGIYTVTFSVTNPEGTASLTKQNSILIFDSTTLVEPCSTSSLNNDGNFGSGVTQVRFGAVENRTSTFIPESGRVDFRCSNSIAINRGVSFNLDVVYESRTNELQFLDVWVDWDNNGDFEASNSEGVNERVLAESTEDPNGTLASINITPPDSAVQDRMLTMRIISSGRFQSEVCDEGFAQRSDDYGIYIANRDVLSLNTSKINTASITLYPNPVTTSLHVVTNGNENLQSYQILNINGKAVTQPKALDASGNIQIFNLPSGFYFIKLSNSDTLSVIKKFIKL